MQASVSVPPTPQGSTGSSSSSRPTQTYVTILKDVLEDQELSLSQIYEKISSKYPYFEGSEAGWKNTVRHTLSLNPTFQNVPRPYPATGKGGLWKIDPQAPETYTRKRDKNKNKNKKTGPLTTTSPQPGAERGAKRTRSSTNDPGGGAWIAPNDEQAVVAGPGEDEDAEGTDDEEEERDEDEGAAEGAAALAELMEAGKGGGGRGEVSPALRLPNLSSGVERPSGRGEGEGAGRTSQPSYRSAGGSSSNSSWSTSQQPTPSSSGEPRRRHQPSNDYPASFLDGSPHSSYQRRDSNYGSSSSHHHASSSNSYFPPSNSSSTSYTHYPSNQVGAPYSSSSSGHLAEGPPRLSYSNPTLPSNASTGYQLPPLNPQAQQPYPLQLPPPPAVPPFSAMHIAEPAPRHFHVQGGWDRSPDVGHSSLLGPRRESAERGGGPGEERGRFESDERRGQRVQEEEEEEGLDDQRDGGRGGERRRWAGGG